ncbi:flagellar biosynthetic protein FliR [Tropicimonas sediminicola]|uniref:Flagellar biosynthetic protein FliR n=1 Tax=Tropicimonas sediminicola TaxID=1031541 RepID=A0A239JE57_9RHOB|nr:flagellar biosynthetic protein FliR [Tropicimonas sediminicola]SNT03892.1 flagellar biosynthetic protein FliR [Tropicimonas sediminicola]
MEELTALAGIGQAGLLAGFVVFLRVGAAMAVLPAFGEQNIPPRIRLSLALAFTLIVAPAVDVSGVQASPAVLLPLLATEPLVGLAFGLVLRLMIFVLQMAGSMAAQSTSLSQLLGGAAGEPLPAFGHVLVIGGLALAVLSGLHVRIAEALVASYVDFPIGLGIDSATLAEIWVARVGDAFALAFSLAAPFVIAAFLYNLALGAINRAMPQLMVVLVGAPAITAGGLALLALLAPLLLQLWLEVLQDVLADPFGGGR